MIYRVCKAHSDWSVVGLGLSRCGEQFKKIDLTDDIRVQEIIHEHQPTVIIHCAAERRVDVVENEVYKTQALNIRATESICQHAASCGAYVIYMSTDYVFDGTKPPHQVTDVPNPLNSYGVSKLDGEHIVSNTCVNNIILRVPILYGNVLYESDSAVTSLMTQVRDT